MNNKRKRKKNKDSCPWAGRVGQVVGHYLLNEALSSNLHSIKEMNLKKIQVLKKLNTETTVSSSNTTTGYISKGY
jgi:hypothetical protein